MNFFLSENFVYKKFKYINLMKKNLSYDGGGLKVRPPPIFIFENNRKSNKVMHCVEKKKSLSGSFEDRAIFTMLNLVMMGRGGLMCP